MVRRDGRGNVRLRESDVGMRCGDLLAVAAVAPEGENESYEQQSDGKFFPWNGNGM